MLTKARHSMQLGYYDTESGKFVMVDTIYNTHHLQFDAQDRIWANNPGDVVTLGELDTKKIDPDNPQGTEEAAQKAWIRIDPNTLKRITGTGYATAVSPVDGTIWQADPTAGGPDNKLYKFDPETGKFKDYPLTAPGRLPHGIDFSTDGNIWFSAESGHLGKFDPKTEKFTYWRLPGPSFKGTGSETGSTEAPYYLWVDQFNTSRNGSQHRVRYRHHFGLDAGVRSAEGIVDGSADALPHAVLHARTGWTYRRRQGGLEGPRNLGHLFFLHA